MQLTCLRGTSQDHKHKLHWEHSPALLFCCLGPVQPCLQPLQPTHMAEPEHNHAGNARGTLIAALISYQLPVDVPGQLAESREHRGRAACHSQAGCLPALLAQPAFPSHSSHAVCLLQPMSLSWHCCIWAGCCLPACLPASQPASQLATSQSPKAL